MAALSIALHNSSGASNGLRGRVLLCRAHMPAPCVVSFGAQLLVTLHETGHVEVTCEMEGPSNTASRQPILTAKLALMRSKGLKKTSADAAANSKLAAKGSALFRRLGIVLAQATDQAKASTGNAGYHGAFACLASPDHATEPTTGRLAGTAPAHPCTKEAALCLSSLLAPQPQVHTVTRVDCALLESSISEGSSKDAAALATQARHAGAGGVGCTIADVQLTSGTLAVLSGVHYMPLLPEQLQGLPAGGLLEEEQEQEQQAQREQREREEAAAAAAVTRRISPVPEMDLEEVQQLVRVRSHEHN